VDQATPAVRFELATQARDIDPQHVRLRLEFVAPHVLIDLVPRQRPARIGHQQRQQLQLGTRQLDGDIGDPRGLHERVELELGEHEPRAIVAVAAQQRAQPRLQLADVVRLDQVVVGAGVEPRDAIGDVDPSGQHQHRRAVALLPHRPHDADPVEVRHRDVEDHDVGFVGTDRRQPLAPADRDRHVPAAQQKRATQRLAHRVIVLDDEDLGRSSGRVHTPK
jgi:hypothetical protein